MGEVEFFDKVKGMNRFLNNEQREALIGIIDAFLLKGKGKEDK